MLGPHGWNVGSRTVQETFAGDDKVSEGVCEAAGHGSNGAGRLWGDGLSC